MSNQAQSNASAQDSREATNKYLIAPPNQFGRTVAKVAVAQICQTIGFEGYKDSALDALADIAIRYLRDLGKSANFNANLAGRTESNLLDVILGLESLKLSQNFPAASIPGNCLASSGSVKEIIEFLSSNDEVPYAQQLPQFPVARSRKLIPSFVQMSETPPEKHIPAWLPAFPDTHTYVHTPMWIERAANPRADKIEQARQRRKAERALLSLQQRLASCNGVEGTSASADCENDHMEKDKAESSSLPSKPGDEDVHVGHGHISVLEAFQPAIKAVKGGFNDEADGGKFLACERRPAVNFKLKTSKKYLGDSLNSCFHKESKSKMVMRLGRDEERDDKKRRAEHILRQSMENPLELTQL